MEIIAAAKRYSKNAAADFIKFGCYLTNPVSQRTVTMAMGAAMFGMIVLNIATANAASTPLFVQLMDAFQTLLTEVQDVILTVVTLSISLCMISLVVVPLWNARATAAVWAALRTIILAYIFFLLCPAFLDTVAQIFNSSAGGGTGTGEV